MKVPFDCRFSSIVTDFSVTLYSRVFFTPYESTRNVKPRPAEYQWKYPFIADFPKTLSLPISHVSPVTSRVQKFFTPYESTQGTWNRVHFRVQWRCTLWLPIFLDRCRFLMSPCISSRVFFTPYESTRDVKRTAYQWVQSKSTLWKRFSDFPRLLPISQSPRIVGYFSSLMKVLGTWNRVQMSTMKVPFDCRFSSIVADFSVTLYSRVFFTP